LKLFKKAKRIKPKPPVYFPIYVGGVDTAESGNAPESGNAGAAGIIIKTLMVCLAASGLSVTFAQIYGIPISFAKAFIVGFFMTALFNAAFVLLKKRAVFPIIAVLFLLFNDLEQTAQNFSVFFDHIMYRLDSRLLATADFAVRSHKAIARSTVYAEMIESAFILTVIILCLAVTLGSRTKFIGSVMIAAAFILIPAFAAEIAGYVPGMELIIVGVFGIYANWVSYSNSGGKTAPPPKKREPFWKFWPGRPPKFYKGGKNALILAGMSLIACIIAAGIFADAVKIDYEKIIQSFSDLTFDIPYGLRKFFKYNFGDIDTGGYFGTGRISSSITPGISMKTPPNGSTPTLRVTLEDNSEKIYLRGGIGVDFLGKSWSVSRDSEEYRELVKLLEEYSPEEQYASFRRVIADAAQEAAELGFEGASANDYIGVQWVKVDYLSRADFILLPTEPYELDYKNANDYVYELDTVLKPKKRFDSFGCDCIYVRQNNPDFSYVLSDIQQLIPPPDPSAQTDAQKYREYIGEVYGAVPESETENIDRLLEEMFPPLIDYNRDKYVLMKRIESYLKYNYIYSLAVDNEAGENTYLGNFLFDTGKGHCSLYATAMTLAARRLGYPARYVTGYVVSGSGKKVDDEYVYDLRERDLHAWTEVYFDGIGWIPFDPTGGVRGLEAASEEGASSRSSVSRTTRAPASPTSRTARASSESRTTTSGTASGAAAVGKSLPKWVMYAVIALIPLTLILAAVLALNSLKRKEQNRFARFKDGRDGASAEEMYLFMFKILAVEGIEKLRGEQPTEFAARVDGVLNGEGTLAEIMPIFEKLEFSDFDLSEEEYAALYGYIDGLYAEAVGKRKAFTKLFRRIKLNK